MDVGVGSGGMVFADVSTNNMFPIGAMLARASSLRARLLRLRLR